MPALQMRAPFGVQIPLFPALKSGFFSNPIQRRRQRPFQAPANDGPYRLPKAVQDRLERELASFRNAEAAFALAAFLGRFWTAPNRLGMPFPIDRRALADHQALDLTESQIRGASKTLERVGFLKRPISKSGSRYRTTADGLHRKPILFEFGADFATVFQAVNQTAKRNSKRLGVRPHPQRSLPSLSWDSQILKSPKNKNPSEKEVFMGEISIRPLSSETALEKALSNLGQALGLPVCM